jgi:endonuclease G, mitochondrial
VLQGIKDPQTVRNNLQFLMETGLIENDTAKIGYYLRTHRNEDLPVVASPYFQAPLPYDKKYIPFGIPSGDTKNYARLGYAFGFNVAKKMPGWVMYIVTGPMLKAERKRRRDRWQFDDSISRDAQLKDWFDAGAGRQYDRGHLLSVVDISGNDTVMDQVNLYSVVIPMTHTLNRKLWYQLERLSRETILSGQTDSLVIISGPLFSKDNQVMNNGVEIPQRVFRIQYDPRHHKTLAWIVPNTEDSPGSLDSYATTVAEIENLTGYHFLQQSLDHPIQSMKTVKNPD